MDYGFSTNRGNGSVDEDINNSQNERKKACTRHTPEQIKLLNLFAEKNGLYPSCHQVKELGENLGLDYMQVKYWFQNRRTHNKYLNDRWNNMTLREQNDSLRAENLLMREALKNVICETCRHGYAPLMTEEYLKLKAENELLKQKRERAMKMLAEMSIQASLSSFVGNSLDISPAPLEQFQMEKFGPFDI